MAGPIDDGYFDRPNRPPPKGGPLDFSRFSSAPLSKPLPVVYGTAWVEGVPLYIDKTSSGFVSEWQDVAGVPSIKGYASGTQALVQMAFCQGPVTSIDYIRRDKVIHHAGATSGGRFNFKHLSAADDASGAAFSYQPTFTLGDASTASLWSVLSAETNPFRRLAYGHLAMMRCERLAFIGGRIPSLFARVRGKLANYADPGILAESTAMGSAQTVYNALPGDVIKDLLTSALWGVGLPVGSVVTDVGSDGSANSSFDRYCHARGWYIGLAITTAQSAFDVVKMILAATDSTIAVSGSTWKVIPYGDTVVGPRATYTYTPPSVSIGLTDDDLVMESPDKDPVELDQVSEEDTRNSYPLTYVPGYGWGEDEAPAESMDVASVATTQLRRASSRSLPCIRSGPHAQQISALMASRSVYNRTTARFSVNWRHPEVEPGDFVSLTHALLGFTAKTFRVLSTEEGPAGVTAIEAVEWNSGVSVVPIYNPQTADGLSFNPTSGGDPGIGKIIDMADDGKLTPVEKPAFFNVVLNIWHSVREGDDAGSGDIVLHGTSLNDASLAFYNYLNLYLGFTYGWVDIDRVWTDPGDRAAQRALLAAWMGETTDVVAATFRAAFGAIETAIVDARVSVLKPMSLGSNTPRTLMERFADKVNVRDYGALGDGTTDDTAAIQAAVTAAGGGGCVYFPTPGTYAAGDFYRTTAPINVTGSDVTLLSDAPDINGNSAVIKNVTSGPVIAVTGERFSMRHVDIQGDDVNIDGVTVTSTSGNIDGTIRNCTFGYLRQAVKLTGRNFHVTDNIFGQCKGAVEMVAHGTGDSRDFFIERNQMEGMGLQTAGGLAVTFKIGANVSNVQVIGNFAYQGRYAKFVAADTGSKKITVQGNVLDALNNSAVEFGDVEDIAVQGNVFRWATPWSTFSPYAPNCYGIVGGAVARGAVQNNLLVNCPGDGIYFNGICTDFSVQGNTLVAPGCKTANTYDGIRITHGTCAVVSITGNIVDAGATAMRYGINWGGSSAAHNHVYGNIVYGAATANYLGTGSPMSLGGGLILGPGPSLSAGAGAPTDNSPVTGSLYLRTDGGATTTLYVKTGATTWTAK